jgi:hypothetical protein
MDQTNICPTVYLEIEEYHGVRFFTEQTGLRIDQNRRTGYFTYR